MMHIINDDPNSKATLDEQAYRAFLRELEISEERIEALEISFVPSLPGASGDYRARPPRIRVCTQNEDKAFRYSQSILNSILLHETRHFQQDDTRGYCYAPGEELLPHGERPSEIDAKRFTRQHRRRCFVHLPLPEQVILYAGSFAPLTRAQKALLVAGVALEFVAAIAINRAIRGGAV